MKTLSTTSAAASASNSAEISLGWNAMPAYGEVMTTLVGTAHTDILSTLKTEKKSIISSFWSTLSNLK
ncbi:MAG TPA: hypothetical protein VGE29_05745 [Prosthecobacter sp.]